MFKKILIVLFAVSIPVACYWAYLYNFGADLDKKPRYNNTVIDNQEEQIAINQAIIEMKTQEIITKIDNIAKIIETQKKYIRKLEEQVKYYQTHCITKFECGPDEDTTDKETKESK